MVEAGSERRQASLTTIITIAAILIVIGFTWRGCWYATPLSDAEISRRLDGKSSDSELQKALYQIKERSDAKSGDLEQFYSGLAGLKDHETPQIRSTLAWVLGGFPEHEPFLPVLRELATDSQPLVRYNAAVSVASRDPELARPVLRDMLGLTVIKAPASGKMDISRNRKTVRFGQIIARVRDSDGRNHDVIAPIDGRVEKSFKSHGDEASAGEDLFRIEPPAGQVENALVALALIGTKDDLPAIQGIIEGRLQMGEGTRRRAEQVRDVINGR